MPARLANSLLVASLVALSLLAAPRASAGILEHLLPPPIWSISLRVTADTCVTGLSYRWGQVALLNRMGSIASDVPKICGGSNGNGIGSLTLDDPLPATPFHIEWKDPQGVQCEVNVELARLSKQSRPPATRFQFAISAQELTVRMSSPGEKPRTVVLPCPAVKEAETQ